MSEPSDPIQDNPEQTIVVSEDLREVAGVTEAKPSPSEHQDPTDDGAKPAKKSDRALILGLSLAGLLMVVAVFIFLGNSNASRFLIACEPDQAIAQQGRSFPPWGTKQMSGPEWKPIAISANAECKAQETDDIDELGGWYLQLLIDQASTQLSGREVTKVDAAQQELDQALLLARTPERRDQRKEIERLLGDVDYWRATAKLKDAQAALADAAKQFEQASNKRPRHVSDASAWSAFVKRVSDELKGGPLGVTTTLPALPGEQPQTRPTAPFGVALPVEPTPGSDVPAASAPDAGVPGGGVLL